MQDFTDQISAIAARLDEASGYLRIDELKMRLEASGVGYRLAASAAAPRAEAGAMGSEQQRTQPARVTDR